MRKAVDKPIQLRMSMVHLESMPPGLRMQEIRKAEGKNRRVGLPL